MRRRDREIHFIRGKKIFDLNDPSEQIINHTYIQVFIICSVSRYIYIYYEAGEQIFFPQRYWYFLSVCNKRTHVILYRRVRGFFCEASQPYAQPRSYYIIYEHIKNVIANNYLKKKKTHSYFNHFVNCTSISYAGNVIIVIVDHV